MKNLLFVCSILLMLASCGNDNTTVIIETNMGTMTGVLYNSTPKHKANFIKLANEHYYDSLLFHRVIKGFMIQGGDPDSKNAPAGKPLGNGGPGYTIPAEISSYHYKGALSAARLGDQMNPAKASSGSQFYIVHGNKPDDNMLNQIQGMRTNVNYSLDQIALYKEIGGAPHLDGEYTVFGEITVGMDVIDKIAESQTASERPVQDIQILKIRVN